MSSEFELDVQELTSLLNTAKRRRVRTLLENEIASLTARIASEKGRSKEPEHVVPLPAPPSASFVSITKYSWLQEGNTVEIHVPLEGVGEAKDRAEFTPSKRSVDLKVNDVQGKNYRLVLNSLYGPIDITDSKMKVKKNSIVLKLKKEDSSYWAKLIGTRKDKIEPKADKEGDVGENLMKMMKNMYDEGDEDMKRTIAKAWYESQQKRTSE